MRKVFYLDKPQSLSESYSTGLKFTYASPPESGVYKQAAPWFLCKDYLQDCAWAQVNGRTFGPLHGLKWSSQAYSPLSMSRTRMLWACDNSGWGKNFSAYMKASVEFVGLMEAEMKMPKTRLYECELPEGKVPGESPLSGGFKEGGCVLMTEGSGKWMRCPVAINLYGMLLRFGCRHTTGQSFDQTLANPSMNLGNDQNDASRLKVTECAKKLILIRAHGLDAVFGKDVKANYPESFGSDWSNIHCYWGFMNYCVGYSGSMVNPAHWYKDPTQKKEKALAATT